MSAKTLSRTLGAAVAAAAMSLAVSAPALATPAVDHDCDCGGARVPAPSLHMTAPGTDVSSPDQQAPIPPSTPVNAPGTDVSAPDQQNPLPASRRVHNPTTAPLPRYTPVAQPANASSPGTGSSWDDAGLWAAGILAIALVAFGGVTLVRRRHTPGAPLAH